MGAASRLRSWRAAPISPSTSASISSCSTASATERRKSPSSLFCSSSISAILSSVIGSSVHPGGSRKSTVSHLSDDHLPLAPNFHHLRGRYPPRELMPADIERGELRKKLQLAVRQVVVNPPCHRLPDHPFVQSIDQPRDHNRS